MRLKNVITFDCDEIKAMKFLIYAWNGQVKLRKQLQK
jgi:hypothetical protein